MAKYIILGAVLLGWVITAPASAQYSAENSDYDYGWFTDPTEYDDGTGAAGPSDACDRVDLSEYEHPTDHDVVQYEVHGEEWICDYTSKEDGNEVFDQEKFDKWSERDAEWFYYEVYLQ